MTSTTAHGLAGRPAPPLTPREDFQRQAAEVLELARPQLEDFAARPDVRALLERAGHPDISDTIKKA